MSDAKQLAQVAARALVQTGSEVLFGIPGGGNNLEVIGAAEAEGMRFVLAHTETAAVQMAGVYSELTRIPTGCVVTRGPGAASSINGVAQAFLDRQPVVILTDAVPAKDVHRVAHQRLDQPALFAPITKWSGVLGPGNAKEVMEHGIELARTPRAGPVHLDFDPSATRQRPLPPSASRIGSLAALNARLAAAKKPVVVIGIGARDDSAAIRALLRGTNIPVLQTYKAKGVIADSSPNAAGILTGATIEGPVLAAADAILTIGLDTVELIPNPWPYPAPLLSLNSWVEDSPYAPSVVAVVGPLSELISGLTPLQDTWHADFAQDQRQSGLEKLLSGPVSGIGLAPWEVVRRVRAIAPTGSIATVDAGAHMLVAMPLWTTENPGEVLISSGLATMGFALPAAIAAAIARPGVRVFCLVGDGGLGMVLAELETVARLNLPITIVVFNDSSLSLIKIKQQLAGHGGENAVSYRPTDFAKIADGCGVPSVRVTCVNELDAATTQSLEMAGPMLLDVLVNPVGYVHVLEVIRGGLGYFGA